MISKISAVEAKRPAWRGIAPCCPIPGLRGQDVAAGIGAINPQIGDFFQQSC